MRTELATQFITPQSDALIIAENECIVGISLGFERLLGFGKNREDFIGKEIEHVLKNGGALKFATSTKDA